MDEKRNDPRACGTSRSSIDHTPGSQMDRLARCLCGRRDKSEPVPKDGGDSDDLERAIPQVRSNEEEDEDANIVLFRLGNMNLMKRIDAILLTMIATTWIGLYWLLLTELAANFTLFYSTLFYVGVVIILLVLRCMIRVSFKHWEREINSTTDLTQAQSPFLYWLRKTFIEMGEAAVRSKHEAHRMFRWFLTQPTDLPLHHHPESSSAAPLLAPPPSPLPPAPPAPQLPPVPHAKTKTTKRAKDRNRPSFATPVPPLS